MDVELEDLTEDYVEPSEIDWEYEFDAARFFDFCCPESDREAQEAERWFAVAGNYPVSPLVMKLYWGGDIQGEDTITCSSLDDCKSSNADVGICSDGSPSGAMKTKTTSVPSSSKPRTSTLMKPTASHLAKVNKARDLLSSHLCKRFQKSPIHIDQRSLQKSPGFDNLATKRQKLEIGYLCKVSHLKHQALLLHKKSQKEGTVTPKIAHSKMKVTVPKEPELQTQQRAINRRSRTNSESSEHSELEIQTCRSRSLNRKAHTVIQPKKSKAQLPVFQAFNLKTTQRALQRSSRNELKTHNSDSISQSIPAELKRSCIPVHPTEVKKTGKKSDPDDALKKEKHETPLKLKVWPISNKIFPTKDDTFGTRSGSEEAITAMDLKLQKDQRLSHNPPTDLFNKLSLRSEPGSDAVSQPNIHMSNKGSKENAPDCFQPEFRWCGGKLNQFGSGKAIPGMVNESNMSRRSLGIR
ncbi:uncharacterized protein [Coffea arabica]|uniref:Uncharacterized protein isoform X2 n=1 Tax=Coffea arabica TaxID=13443 RepID=A0ABM4WR37_COFAR